MDLPYFKVFPAETLADERFAGWSLEERGAWFSLLLHAWVNGSIPGDEAAIARIVHLDTDSFLPIWQGIKDRFIPHPDEAGRLTSRRLEIEREDAVARSQAGQRGAKSRWTKKNPPDATAMRPQCDRNATASEGAMRPPMPAAQRNAAQRSAPQSARMARWGVMHPAFEAAEHWTKTVWPKLSPTACLDLTEEQKGRLAALCDRLTTAEVVARMDRAAADKFWADKLTLDRFMDDPDRWVQRNAVAGKPSATAPAQQFTQTRRIMP